MTLNLNKYLPSPAETLNMQPEELALPLLKALNEYSASQGDSVNITWISSSLEFVNSYAGQTEAPAIEKALAEAWAFLESSLMIVGDPSQTGSAWQMISRRGKEWAKSIDINSYQYSRLLPEEMLRTELTKAVRTLYISGDYDTAIFKSFRLIEVKIRKLGSYDNKEVGVPLARKAFNPKDGPLTDKDSDGGERDAMANLFAGALGTYKNPTSHRLVEFEDPIEVAQIIHFANQLLVILDRIEKRMSYRMPVGSEPYVE